MSQRKYLAFAVLSATSLVMGFLLHAASCGVDLDGFNTQRGSCDDAKDDDDPCTGIACEGEGITFPRFPEGTACQERKNKGRCDKHGKCKLDCLDVPGSCICETAADCPSDFCSSATCSSGQCMPMPQNEGQLLPEQTLGDCIEIICENGKAKDNKLAAGMHCDAGVCNGQGKCVQCNEDTDCPEGTAPNDRRCIPSTKTCASCSNEVKDADEDGLNCNLITTAPSPCGLCDGQGCSPKFACASGQCANDVCCNEDCVGTCRSCNFAGKRGVCTNVPAGAVGECAINNACNSSQLCVPTNNSTRPNGTSCLNDSQCISLHCVDNTCKQKDGPCTDDAQCASKMCVNYTCALP
jgi:hypothetical protein